MAAIPVTLSGFYSRLFAGALAATTFSCATMFPKTPSQYGFRLNSAESQDTTDAVDQAFFEIANRATKNYTELAYVILAFHSLNFRVEFGTQGDSVSGNLIRVQGTTECLANGALLPILGALIADLLGRDTGGAVLGAAAELIQFCPPNVPPKLLTQPQ